MTMTSEQAELIESSGLEATDFHLTSEGWSHNGFVAWQLELADESKRVATDDSKIAAILRQLDDMED